MDFLRSHQTLPPIIRIIDLWKEYTPLAQNHSAALRGTNLELGAALYPILNAYHTYPKIKIREEE